MVANSNGQNSHSSNAGRTVRSATSAEERRRSNARTGTARQSATRKPRQGRRHKRIRDTWRTKHPILFWALIIIFTPIILGTLVFAVMYVNTDIPQPDKIAMADKTKVYYADGKTEIGSFAEQNREIISCSALKPYVGNAIVASENRSFYKDGGIDFKGIGRAIIHNVTSKGRWGGSTITQQYAAVSYTHLRAHET